jgi:ATP-dependent helicase HrpA
MTGLHIQPGNLDETAIDDHFRMRIRVVDAEGAELASGRDLVKLQERLGEQAQRRFMDRQGAGFNRDGETDWTFGELEARVDTGSGSPAFPALVDQEDAVGLRLFDTWAEAVHAHNDGVLRLLSLKLADKMKYLRGRAGLDRRALLAWSSIGSSEDLAADLAWRALGDTAGDLSGVRDEAQFESLCAQVRKELLRVHQRLAGQLEESLLLYARLSPVVYGKLQSRRPGVFHDISSQFEDMLYPGFITELWPGRLAHYPRYLAAVQERLAQLDLDPLRDAQRMAQIEPWWQRYLEAIEAGQPYDEALDAYRWLVEEFRVSVFAQRLGTAEKVSEKRLRQAWKATGIA